VLPIDFQSVAIGYGDPQKEEIYRDHEIAYRIRQANEQYGRGIVITGALHSALGNATSAASNLLNGN